MLILIVGRVNFRGDDVMESIGAYEARTKFADLLERVASGDTVTVTKHGVPVAVLKPPITSGTRRISEIVEDIELLRKGFSLSDTNIYRELVESGRD